MSARRWAGWLLVGVLLVGACFVGLVVLEVRGPGLPRREGVVPSTYGWPSG